MAQQGQNEALNRYWVEWTHWVKRQLKVIKEVKLNTRHNLQKPTRIKLTETY